MTNMPLNQLHGLQDRFGRQVAARLTAGTVDISHDVTERLRVARAQAVVKRRKPVVNLRAASSASGIGSATLTFGGEGPSWWNRIGSALPLIALAAGLILIHTVQNDRRATELAEVDAALLTDDLPPSAYADPGFVQFLKSGNE